MFVNVAAQCCCQRAYSVPMIFSRLSKVKKPTFSKLQSLRSIYTSQLLQAGSGFNVFDRNTKTHHKNIAARYPDQEVYDYLKSEVAERLVDRLADVVRTFPKALDLGAGKGYVSRHVTKDEVGKLYQLDSSNEMLNLCGSSEVETENFLGDEELLPFPADFFDLVISNLSLHWVNDIPGVLFQVNQCLKEDGAFVGAIFGSETLYELRCSLQLAEIEREGGFGQHVSPFTEMRDIGSLLQRANLNLTTVDFDEVVVDYPSMFALMHDLKGMGESNATWKRKSILHRDTMLAAAAIYKEMYGNEDGSIPATFQVLYMIGWKKSESQAQPLERGSATTNFADLESFGKALKDGGKNNE